MLHRGHRRTVKCCRHSKAQRAWCLSKSSSRLAGAPVAGMALTLSWEGNLVNDVGTKRKPCRCTAPRDCRSCRR